MIEYSTSTIYNILMLLLKDALHDLSQEAITDILLLINQRDNLELNWYTDADAIHYMTEEQEDRFSADDIKWVLQEFDKSLHSNWDGAHQDMWYELIEERDEAILERLEAFSEDDQDLLGEDNV